MVINPRTKLVNFRLSEEEFEDLRQACGSLGARSISDFARSAVLGKFKLAAEPAIENRLVAMNSKVGELESSLNNLMRQLGFNEKSQAMTAAAGAGTGTAYNPSHYAQHEE